MLSILSLNFFHCLPYFFQKQKSSCLQLKEILSLLLYIIYLSIYLLSISIHLFIWERCSPVLILWNALFLEIAIKFYLGCTLFQLNHWNCPVRQLDSFFPGIPIMLIADGWKDSILFYCIGSGNKDLTPLVLDSFWLRQCMTWKHLLASGPQFLYLWNKRDSEFKLTTAWI